MSQIIIKGEKKLSGEVFISGAKNAAVAIVPAAIVANDICLIENLPVIEDVVILSKTLESIGVNEDSILVAVPEVRIDSRVTFLREGKEKGAFCAASIPVSEAHEFEQAGVYELCDLIAVNQDEARAICGSGLSGEGLFIKTCEYLCNWNKDIQLVVTEGADGAWCGNSQFREYLKPYPANVVNTTGAGDAFLGATIGMISQGFPLIHSGREEFPYTATQVAAVCSGIAIGLEDSIPKSLDKEEVFSRLKQYIQA